jgi:hypothetical protein
MIALLLLTFWKAGWLEFLSLAASTQLECHDSYPCMYRYSRINNVTNPFLAHLTLATACCAAVVAAAQQWCCRAAAQLATIFIMLGGVAAQWSWKECLGRPDIGGMGLSGLDRMGKSGVAIESGCCTGTGRAPVMKQCRRTHLYHSCIDIFAQQINDLTSLDMFFWFGDQCIDAPAYFWIFYVWTGTRCQMQ